MNEQCDNPFIIDDLAKAPDENPRSFLRPWDIYMIFGTEPKLAIIAVDAATLKWLWKKARIAAFEAAMDKAGKLNYSPHIWLTLNCTGYVLSLTSVWYTGRGLFLRRSRI